MKLKYEYKFLNYVKTTIWKDDTPDEILIELSQKVFDETKNDISKVPFIFRICGQSGSGKTTQGLKSIQHVCKNNNLNPIVIAVRNFAKYHPKYTILMNSDKKNEMRELTNGFALKLLCLVLVKFIQNNYSIIMDTTILDFEFEKILFELINENNYKLNYMIFSVPKNISDNFILKRTQQKENLEKGRIVYKSSSDFFYNILESSLEKLSQLDTINNAIVWTAFNKDPIYFGKLKNSIPLVKKYRNIECNNFQNENELLNAKIEFLNKNYDKIFNATIKQ